MIRNAVRAERSIAEGKVHIYLQRFDLLKRETYCAEPVVLTKHIAGESHGPTFRIESEQAQELMDDLWRSGFRPSEAGASAGALSATERHLKDLQGMVAQLLLPVLKMAGDR